MLKKAIEINSGDLVRFPGVRGLLTVREIQPYVDVEGKRQLYILDTLGLVRSFAPNEEVEVL